MAIPEIQKVPSPEDRTLPVFDEVQEITGQIRDRAYQLFCDRGLGDGFALQDWLAAEREICWPAAELEETRDEFLAKVALPGFEPGDVKVTASPRELIIKASHQSSKKDKRSHRTCWSEFQQSDAFRHVVLPSAIDVEKIKARFENGLLEIAAAKAVKTAPKAKKIAIPTAA